MKIEKANIDDNEILSEITKKSKTFWGYSEKQILEWSDDLTISKNYIESNSTFKLLDEDKVIGYYSYILEKPAVKLDNLFVLPEYIGKGFGRHLVNDFLTRMRSQKIKRIILHSDPNAEEFYLKIGFKKIGEFETSIKNRFMPIMEMDL